MRKSCIEHRKKENNCQDDLVNITCPNDWSYPQKWTSWLGRTHYHFCEIPMQQHLKTGYPYTKEIIWILNAYQIKNGSKRIKDLNIRSKTSNSRRKQKMFRDIRFGNKFSWVWHQKHKKNHKAKENINKWGLHQLKIFCTLEAEKDGGGVRQGDCQPPHKYTKNSSRYGTTPTKQPLDDSRRLQASRGTG